MEAESVILLLISVWLLVAAAALWGMLRIVRRHAQYGQVLSSTALHAQPQPMRFRRKPLRPRLPRPVLSPSYRAAQHLVHR